ncbi:hypothetical protein [Roseospira visakhapatnamensis]|uniref:Uncharacterized protein n=1 Tax=Roseospira visakhapatnamensis TaxID=390880 RepID=A0A7W6RC88_9PROT|nr:hypothetical protein [Roseospira visakhapatnamensis]
MLKSNRLVMEVSSRSVTETVVVRGQNIPGTLRMAAMVAERYMRDPQVLHPENPVPPDWDDLWTRKISPYEKSVNPDNWASVHVRGKTIYASLESDPIMAIERVAQGADLDERTIRAATAGLFGAEPDEDVVVQHDSQTAVVITPFSAYLRAAVLERKGGRTGSFSVSVYHSETRRVRVGLLLNFCADVIECCNLRQFLERLPAGRDDPRTPVPEHLRQQVGGANGRRRDLMQFIKGFETAHKVQYRPDRPDL